MQNAQSGSQLVTQEGLDKLHEELERRKNVTRHKIADRIERAKELGDLSENAEYAEAKDEQAFNEGRIIELEQLIKSLTVVEQNGDKSVIDLGSTVEVEVNGATKTFTLVSFNEVDPEDNKISNESPIGDALMGKKKGDIITVKLPAGNVVYKVLKVS